MNRVAFDAKCVCPILIQVSKKSAKCFSNVFFITRLETFYDTRLKYLY